MLEIPYRALLQKRPALAIEHAVKGMLPKNPLGRKMAGKLKVYAGGAHPHAAQKPVPLAV
jgi:large subunit ribosomal protein L13